ncbi:cell division protein FtsX [Clostridium carboxidivorans P7]|nr:permease-like cell division protein FtsX [Clostridium carboxidivorans]AKN34116.1 cell division protein FtsX [Clostridium carboxidivorans P7]
MRNNVLNLFLKDALKSFRRNYIISTSSIATVMSTLFILGIFLIFLLNVKSALIGIYSQFEIQVTLMDDIKITDQQNIYNKIKAAKGVTDITFGNKKQSSENVKKKLDNRNKSLLADFENDTPVSASYIIKVNRSEDIPKIISQTNGLQGINEINSKQSIPKKIFVIVKTLQWIGVVLFLILMVASSFLIKNTIKLAIYPRRNEIIIMQYVGATDWFIRWPFIFEGIIIGFLGAVSAVIVIYFLYSFVYRKVTPYLVMMSISFIDPSFILTTISWSFILIGIIMSVIGSILGIRKFLIV